MQVETPEEFAQLVERVDAFHITDRAMRAAQARAREALAHGNVTESVRAAYAHAVQRYFGAFQREGQAQLRDVDRRLEHVNQIAFNLNAERAVAVKRIEATQAILALLERADR
jgi:hypothetical protein